MPRIKADDTWQHETTTLTAVSDGYMKAVGHQGQRQQHAMVLCSCGTSIAFECAAHRLRSCVQPTKSCGCLQKQATRAACFKPVAAGEQWHGKYTTLTATTDSYMKPGTDGTPTHCVMVQCSCPDKTTREMPVASLRSGNTQSCGCAMPLLVADAQRMPVHAGDRWDGPETSLTAVKDGFYRPYSGGNHQFVEVVCSCRNAPPFEVLVSNLKRGLTVSCGCYHSEITSRANALRNSRDGDRGHRRGIYRSGERLEEMMSAWELAYAHALDAIGVLWEYEPEWFHLSKGMRYLPDFYLPERMEWHEVKWDHQVHKFEKKATAFRARGNALTVISSAALYEFTGMREYGIRKTYGQCHWRFVADHGWQHAACGKSAGFDIEVIRESAWRCSFCRSPEATIVVPGAHKAPE